MCRVGPWNLADRYVNVLLQDDLGGGLVIGGPTLPSAALICANCGYTALFNLLVLGLHDLLPSQEQTDVPG